VLVVPPEILRWVTQARMSMPEPLARGGIAELPGSVGQGHRPGQQTVPHNAPSLVTCTGQTLPLMCECRPVQMHYQPRHSGEPPIRPCV